MWDGFCEVLGESVGAQGREDCPICPEKKGTIKVTRGGDEPQKDHFDIMIYWSSWMKQ